MENGDPTWVVKIPITKIIDLKSKPKNEGLIVEPLLNSDRKNSNAGVNEAKSSYTIFQKWKYFLFQLWVQLSFQIEWNRNKFGPVFRCRK